MNETKDWVGVVRFKAKLAALNKASAALRDLASRHQGKPDVQAEVRSALRLLELIEGDLEAYDAHLVRQRMVNK